MVKDMAPAAAGLELLCRQKPELLPVLIRSRTDGVASSQIRQLINGVSPGLYELLEALTYSKEDFAKGQEIISDAINEEP